MRYRGKLPKDLTPDELNTALRHCLDCSAMVFYMELADEQRRRDGVCRDRGALN